MKLLARLLKSKEGRSMLTPMVSVLISVLFLILLNHYIYLYSMLMGITDYTQEAILQTATSNAFNAYGGVREGNSSAHQYTGSGAWQELVSTAEVSQRLKEMLQLTARGNSLYLYDADGSLRYGLSNIQVHCSNVEVGASANDVTLTFTTTVTAEVPMRFLGATLHVRKPISLKSYYTPRF